MTQAIGDKQALRSEARLFTGKYISLGDATQAPRQFARCAAGATIGLAYAFNYPLYQQKIGASRLRARGWRGRLIIDLLI